MSCVKKVFENLIHPEIRMANCFGSYIVSCFNYFADSMSKDDIFLFLASCYPGYLTLDVEKLKKNFSNNPWGYKPVRIFDSKGVTLFDSEECFRNFMSYLKNNFNININIVSFATDDLKDVIIRNIENNNLIIVFTDDYFNSHNTRNFKTNHNPHGLLIKGFDLSKEKYEIIDVDYNYSYKLNFNEVVRFIPANFSNYMSHSYLTVTCDKFVNKINYNQELIDFLHNLKGNAYLSSFITEVVSNLSNSTDELEYFYRGYDFTIKFQVLSVSKARLKVLEKSNLLASEDSVLLTNKAIQLMDGWKSVSDFMSAQIEANTFAYEPLLNKINNLFDLENEMYEQLKRVSIYF